MSGGTAGARPRRIGLIGFGYVGRQVFRRIARDPAWGIGIAFVHNRSAATLAEVPPELVLHDLAGMADRAPDLVVEMAHPDYFFHRALFPITDSGGAGIVVCDCSVPDGAPTPIRRIEPAEMAEGLPAPKAPSFGAMVVRWIEAWDRPLWGYDAAAGRWVEYPENRTEADNRSRLV